MTTPVQTQNQGGAPQATAAQTHKKKTDQENTDHWSIWQDLLHKTSDRKTQEDLPKKPTFSSPLYSYAIYWKWHLMEKNKIKLNQRIASR